jgi:hypothetical protein
VGFWSKLFGKNDTSQNDFGDNRSYDYSNEQNFFIFYENEVKGPHNLEQLKSNYIITGDTLITIDTLNGEWYEAKYYECFDDLFGNRQDFYINEFGEIIKN